MNSISATHVFVAIVIAAILAFCVGYQAGGYQERVVQMQRENEELKRLLKDKAGTASPTGAPLGAPKQ